MGEWLLRKLQLKAQGRDAERGDRLLVTASPGADRMVAMPLQSPQAALLARLPPASAASRIAHPIMAGIPCRRLGQTADLNRRTLTLTSGHRDGAGHKTGPLCG